MAFFLARQFTSALTVSRVLWRKNSNSCVVPIVNKQTIAEELGLPPPPKRPQPPFIRFANFHRDEYKRRYPNLNLIGLNKKIAEKWNGLTRDEKDIWRDKYKKEIAVYYQRFSRGDNGNDLSTSDELSIQVEKHEKKVNKRKKPLGKPAVIEELQRKFGLTYEEVLTILANKQFDLVADTAVLQTIYCLKDFEISKERLQRSPWLLLRPADDLREIFKLLTDKYLFHNYFDGLGFSYFTISKIRKFQKKFELEKKLLPEHKNRIYYMADRLMVPVDQLTEKIVRAPRILDQDLQRIDRYINLLPKYEVPPEKILSYLRFFYTKFDVVEQRLQELHEAGYKGNKLRLCETSEDRFTRAVKKYKVQKDVLGECQSKEEYLMKRLQCTPEELRTNLATACDILKLVSVTKIQKMIDLLLSEGLTPVQIGYDLNILHHNLEKIAARIKRLKDVGVTDIYLSDLLKRNREFDKYCDKLQKNVK